MAWVPIISIIFLLIILLYFSKLSSLYEGFAEQTIYDRAVDRANPLAAVDINPLNGKIPIGISQNDGIIQRNMHQTALNIPTAMAINAVSFSQVTPNNEVSPRIDNENSLLGLSKFCKDNGTGDRPFDNAKFNENCGMCISAGTLYDKTEFTTPTGVVVYKADKEKFMQEKSSNGHPFPRAIPSMSVATCVGASKGSDSEPVLALNQNDYDVYLKRYKCIHGGGTSCGTCQTNKNKKAWIDQAGGFKVSKLILWGSGKATVSVGGVAKGSQSNLSQTTATEYILGTVKEGALVEIDVRTEISAGSKSSVFGVLRSETPSGNPYTLAIDKFLTISTQTNSSFGNTKSVTVSNTNISVTEIIPRGSSLNLAITGAFPLTFVDSDQFAAFDCPNGPYSMGDFSILDSTDACANPRGQGVDNYSSACLQKTLTDAGCAATGSWYLNPDSLRSDYSGKTVGEMKTLFQAGDVRDVDYMMKCKGQDISTPCDPYLTSGVPNQACLSYLYSGGNSNWAARGFDPIYTGTAGKTDLTCRPTGSLNPTASNELLNKATSGYDTFSGFRAAKKFLNDVYGISTDTTKANNIPNANGGRYDSWVQCIGDSSISRATVPGAPVVSGNAADGSASITWTTPSAGGSPITDYIVSISPEGTVNKNGANSATITGLTNGMNYTISVLAKNIMGDSSAGQVTVKPVGNPSKPRDVSGNAGISSATISWNAPVSNGGAEINLYTVIPSPACSTCTGLTTTGARSTTITGLESGTAYTFRVSATNSSGKTSPESDPSSAVTTYFPSGTVSGSPRCDGYNRVQDYHNGSGGTYTQTITANDTTCGYFAQCDKLGETAPDGECGTTGMRQRYKYGTGLTSGSCVSVADGDPYCDSTCSGAKANGGCAACSTVSNTPVYEWNATGEKRSYTVKNNNGQCQNEYTAYACDITKDTAKVNGGCAAYPGLGTTDYDCEDNTGRAKPFTWGNGDPTSVANSRAGKKNYTGEPICNPTLYPKCAAVARGVGGCAACATLGQTGFECDNTGRARNYRMENGTTSGSCSKVYTSSYECSPAKCPAASQGTGCAVPCSSPLRTVQPSTCDASGKRQKYKNSATAHGTCYTDLDGVPQCDPTCPGASADGGCTNACLFRATGQDCNRNTPCSRGRCDFTPPSPSSNGYSDGYSGICVACHANCNGTCDYVDGVYKRLYVPGASAAAIAASTAFLPCPTLGRTRHTCSADGYAQHYKNITGPTSGSCQEVPDGEASCDGELCYDQSYRIGGCNEWAVTPDSDYGGSSDGGGGGGSS